MPTPPPPPRASPLSSVVTHNDSDPSLFRFEPTAPPPALTRRDVAIIALIVAAVLAVFSPLHTLAFSSNDDYATLARANEEGLSLHNLFFPQNQHVMPVFQALAAVQYALFGLNASAYFTVTLLLHASNALFVIALVWLITGEKLTAYLSGLIFGVSDTYLIALIPLFSQSIVLSLFWFLISALLYVRFLQTGNGSLCGLSAVSHVLGLCSFAYGFEIPILYFFLYHLIRRPPLSTKSILQSLIAVAPFVLDVILVEAMRRILLQRSGQPGFMGETSLMHTLSHVPEALGILARSIHAGFITSFLGGGLAERVLLKIMPSVPTAAHVIAATFTCLVVLWIVLGFDWRDRTSRPRVAIIVFFLLWAAGQYFLPILPRVFIGYYADDYYRLPAELFHTMNWYRYLPCVPAAAAFAMLIRHSRAFTGGGNWRRLRVPMVLLLAYFLTANVYSIRRSLSLSRKTGDAYTAMRDELLGGINQALDAADTDIALSDREIIGLGGEEATWSSRILRACLPPSRARRVHFLPEDEFSNFEPAQRRFEFRDGRLVPIDGPTRPN